MNEVKKTEGLELLRKPFEDHQIGKLPKPTRHQTDSVKSKQVRAIKCNICEGWHHPDVIHLDYVGHAALTDRLLDVDPKWSWEPLAVDERGLPCFDNLQGLWIKLTVLGVTRLGYGSTDKKAGGDAVKEIIGDALRNAAMRFGAALDLWHKGDLKPGASEPKPDPEEPRKPDVDIKKLESSRGMAFIAGFKTPDEAIEQAKITNHVSSENETKIRDIWHAAQEEKSNENS
jgi:hypothetical protein